ncbi:integrase core domain-containing protein [Nitrospira sp. Ecomares 2.1]
MAGYGRPQYIRSDNSPKFIAHNLTRLLKDQEIRPSRIDPGKPWQKGSNESFNGTFRRECVEAILLPLKVRPPLRHNPLLKGGNRWDRTNRLNAGRRNDEPLLSYAY